MLSNDEKEATHYITIEPVFNSLTEQVLLNHEIQLVVYRANSWTEAVQVREEYYQGFRPEFERSTSDA